MAKIGVIGAGSWATALVKVMVENGHEINWWVKDEKVKRFIQLYKRNPDYLRAVKLDFKPESLQTDISVTVRESDIIFIVIPSLFLEETLKGLDPVILKNKIIVSAVKGLVPVHHMTISNFMFEFFKIQNNQFVFLTGPTHAEEVIRNKLTYMTLASYEQVPAQETATLLENPSLKIRIAKGISDLEYASVLKNIYAIATGIAHSLGYGDNFIAVLVSNAIREMNKFLKKANNHNKNILSSGFLGDLLVTSFSQLSRNRTFGHMIGRGYSPKTALLEMNMVPEGYYSVKSFYKIMKESPVNMKIVRTVYRILYKNADPFEEMKKLEKHLN